MPEPYRIVFQSAKLGDLSQILAEIEWVKELLRQDLPVGRVYGVSGGVLSALAFTLALSARLRPQEWGAAQAAPDEFSAFLRQARSRHIRALNLNPRYGFYNLRPLRRWLAGRLRAYAGRDDLFLSQLPVDLYLCALDQDGTLTLFGRPDEALQFQYHFVHVGPPQDAPLLDAMTAALSTLLSTGPAQVNGGWYRDCRPAIVDAGAMVADLEGVSPRQIVRRRPHAPLRNWKLNFLTSSFIMHSQHERNQALLSSYYLDLLDRHHALADAGQGLLPAARPAPAASVHHIQLPYIGSTEAITNMRQSVENKTALMARFGSLLEGQLDEIPFDRPANVIYGAGGFSGILAGLTTARAVDAGLERGGGQIEQVYGVSAGVVNGFFHAVQIAAGRHPDLYRPAARRALADLEEFVAAIEPRKIARLNLNPLKFWQGWANLGPLEEFLQERLAAYTGSQHPAQITFDDIALPLTVTAARGDGFTDFLGMQSLDRRMVFGGHSIEIKSAPVIKSILAGWSMNTYIQPTALNGQHYRDGGGAFYDVGLFVACLDPQLTNLINIHLDEPEGHSYNLPPQPDLVRIVFDTHNYTFPEERRRMYLATNLLYEHYRLRAEYALRLEQQPKGSAPLPPDFRRNWQIDIPREVL